MSTPKARISDDVVAGAVAGASARLFTAPFDVLKIRFQLQFADKVKYTSLLQAFSTVVKEEGLIGLWKGNLSATYLWVSYAMIQFAVYGFLKNTLEGIPDPFMSKATQQQKGLFDPSSTNQKKIQHNGIEEQPKGRIWKATLLFLAGAGAGIAATSATYPFDIMRTQFAIQGKEKAYSSMHSFISHTFRTKGIQGLYAGLNPAIVGIAPYMGLNFAIYDSVKSLSESPMFVFNRNSPSKPAMSQKDDSRGQMLRALGSLIRKGACGAIAGGASKFMVYPLDTIKKRMQVQVLRHTLEGLGDVPKYNSAWHCAAKIYTEEGMKGFYKGIVPTVAKSVVATAVTFAAYEGMKDFLAWNRLQNSIVECSKRPPSKP